ncbi:hypothetical protein GXM_03764 [Nostoc sphaeroides CCNUC1]|uniref:Uncharacterized protein n=1 Tax=Nostoc sphaeroides CCNUC1 TaxID=2653204 RepID=A0A5P8W118_9NOSO|nr:hypothetical protein GXM_03764 [Nostoc sphaeroides CCNUC1]
MVSIIVHLIENFKLVLIFHKLILIKIIEKISIKNENKYFDYLSCNSLPELLLP